MACKRRIIVSPFISRRHDTNAAIEVRATPLREASSDCVISWRTSSAFMVARKSTRSLFAGFFVILLLGFRAEDRVHIGVSAKVVLFER